MINYSVAYYEECGDKLFAQGRMRESARAYDHAMRDCCALFALRPDAWAHYKQLDAKYHAAVKAIPA